MNSDELSAVYERVHRFLDFDEESYCVTVVVGASIDEVLIAFGGDPAESPVPYDEADDFHTVSLIDLSGGVVAVEDNGFQGSREVVLRKAAANGRAASLCRGIDAETELSVAQAGIVVFKEDVLGGTEAPIPTELAAAFEGLGWDLHDSESCALVVIERFNAVHLDGSAPQGSRLVHRLTPHLDGPAVGGNWIEGADEWLAECADDDPWKHGSEWGFGWDAYGEEVSRRLVRAVLAASVPTQRRLAAASVDAALRAVGWADHPDIVVTTATLEDPSGPTLAPQTASMMRKGMKHARDPESDPPSYSAYAVLECALRPWPVNAALGAFWCASFVLWEIEREIDRKNPPKDWWEDYSPPPSERALAAFRETGSALLQMAFDILGIDDPLPEVHYVETRPNC